MKSQKFQIQNWQMFPHQSAVNIMHIELASVQQAISNFFRLRERNTYLKHEWECVCQSSKKIFWKSSLTLYFTSTLIHLHNISPGHSHVYIYNVMCSSTRKRVRELEIIFHPCPYSDFDASCGMRISAAADSTTSFSLYPSLCK